MAADDPSADDPSAADAPAEDPPAADAPAEALFADPRAVDAGGGSDPEGF